MMSFVKKTVVLGAVLSLFLSMPVWAYWLNEEEGPGGAVWVEDTPEEQSAADGQTPEAPGADASSEAGTAGEEQASPDDTEGAAGLPETAGSAADSSQEAAQDGNLVASNGRQIDLTKPMIALTYDDGPQTSVGNRIMDIAEQYNGRVTFFMVGERVRAHAAEVQRMAADGHEVANHTYSHKYLNKVSAAEILSQVQSCNDEIEAVCGVRPTLMRLPGGNKNQTVLQNVGMPVILWNIDTRDWATRNAQKTIDAVVGKVKDGDIVLMHELYSSTADATASIIPALAAQGFQFVTVSELAQFKGKTLSPGQVYYSMR